MIVHETASHHITVEFELLQVRPPILHQNPNHIGSCKGPRKIKCEYIHKTRYSIYSIEENGEQITTNG